MKEQKNEMQEIYISILDKAYKKVRQAFSPIFGNRDFEAIIQEKVTINSDKIKDISEKIDGGLFKKVIRQPQVNDLVIECFTYVVLCNIFEETEKMNILDNCLNHVLQIIVENYSELTNDRSLEAINTFWELLKETVTLTEDQYDKEIITSVYIKEASQNPNIGTIKIKKTLDNISRMLEGKIVLRDSRFDIVKNDYLKAIKQIYQVGFIYLLGEYKFNDFYIPPILYPTDGKIEPFFRRFLCESNERIEMLRENWKNIFCDNEIIYVVGGAGYGKSLFLRNIINNYSKLNIDSSQDYLLIYCDLKTYYSNGNPNKKSMIEFFQESMVNITGLDKEAISKEFIQHYIEMGRCIFLLDALDEVPKEVRDELHKKIVGFFSTCNPNNKVCITSRDRGFLPKGNIQVIEIFPLTPKDIEDYIDKMVILRKFKKEDKSSFMKQAQVLIEKDFLNNFLVLSLLVNIYKAEKELPENKIDLYKKCFEYIAKKREEEKSKTGYNWDNIYPLMKDSTFINLSTLAAPNNKDIKKEAVEELLLTHYNTKYPNDATAECAIKEFLEFCSNRTELFVPSSTDDTYKFFHRSFFEYFYSRYIHQQATVEKMYELMTKFDIDSEVFELTVALIKEDNELKYQDLVKYIFRKVKEGLEKDHPDYTAFGILTLAMQVIDDAYFIQEYLDVVLKYKHLMKSDQILRMNQKYIYLWIIKAIGKDDEKKEIFRTAYENICITNAFIILSDVIIDSSIHTLRQSSYLAKIDEDSEIFLEMRDSRIDGAKANAFYMLVYNEYYDLRERLNKFNKKSLYGFVNSLGSLPRKQKTAIKRGFTNYEKVEGKTKETLLDFLCSKYKPN